MGITQRSRTRGKARKGVPSLVRKRPDAPTQARDHRRAGCRGRSPRRGTASPPAPQNVGGWSGRHSSAINPDPPLKEGAGHNKTLVPHKRGAGGAAPAGGTGGLPLFWKTSEGGAGGIAAQAKADPPLKEGAGHNNPPLATPPPPRKPQTPNPANPPCKIRTIVL